MRATVKPSTCTAEEYRARAEQGVASCLDIVIGEAMSDVIAIDFDTSIFPMDVLMRAAHWLAADYYIDIRAARSTATLELRPKRAQSIPKDLALRVRNSVLDESLRAQVRAETRGVHEALIRAALQEVLAGRDKSP